MRRHQCGTCLVLGALLFWSGCSGAATEGRVDVYPVSGKVTMSGGPLAGANVAFAPQDDPPQPVAIGRTDNEGNFTLTTYEAGDGAAEGLYKVVITKSAPTAAVEETEAEHSADPNATYGSGHSAGKADMGGGLIPPEYTNSDNTPLSATVKSSGENKFDFEL